MSVCCVLVSVFFRYEETKTSILEASFESIVLYVIFALPVILIGQIGYFFLKRSLVKEAESESRRSFDKESDSTERNNRKFTITPVGKVFWPQLLIFFFNPI